MSDVNLSISSELVRPIIEAKIHAAIVEQLKGSAAVMENVVSRVLREKVSSDGKPDTYGYNSSKEFLQWLCESCIRDSAASAVRESVEAMKPQLKALIIKDLEKRKGQIAEQLVGFFSGASQDAWRINTSVTIQKKD